MRKNILFPAIVVLLLTILFSCKKELAVKNSVSLNASNVTTPKDANFVPFATAAKAAQQVNSSHLVSGVVAKQAVQSTIGLSGKQILDSLAVPDNVNPSYYIFNYVGGGFVIMPADKRVEPILSYSNDGYFPHSGTLPSGLVNWLLVNHKNMQLLRKDTSLKVPPGVAKLWAELNVIPTATGNKVINVDESSPSLTSNISCSAAFKNTFGYSSSAEGSYNYLSVVANLNSGEPVLLSASTDNHTFLFWNWYYLGHEWVCDGYQQTNYTWCPSGDSPGGGESFLSLHMNWGWNEVGEPYDVDGWFPFDQWDVNSYGDQQNYQYNQSMTYNIHP